MLSFSLNLEHRTETTLFQRTVLFAGFFVSFQVVPCFFTSSVIDLLQVVLGLPVFFLVDSSLRPARDIVGLFSEGVSHPCPFSSCNLSPDVVLVCPPPNFFVCGFILQFGFQDVSQTFVNECL